MKQIRKITTPLISEMEKVLNRALDNVYINTALKVFLVLYAALAAPKFPPKLVFLMDNTLVRICIAFLIVFMALRDPAMALMIAIAFIVTLQTANRLRLYNTDLSIGMPGETSWLPSVKEMFFAGEKEVEEAAAEEEEEVEEVVEEVDGEITADGGDAAAPVVPEEEGGEETEDKCASQRIALDECEAGDVKCESQRAALDKCEAGETDEEDEEIAETFSVYPSSGARYSYAPFN